MDHLWDQSNHRLSVEFFPKAIRVWPQLEARDLRLSNPVTTTGGTLGKNSWQRRFMIETKQRPNRVTYSQNARFAQEAIAMTDKLPFVERHAWFAANPYPWRGTVPQINFVSDDMKLISWGFPLWKL